MAAEHYLKLIFEVQLFKQQPIDSKNKCLLQAHIIWCCEIALGIELVSKGILHPKREIFNLTIEKW